MLGLLPGVTLNIILTRLMSSSSALIKIYQIFHKNIFLFSSSPAPLTAFLHEMEHFPQSTKTTKFPKPIYQPDDHTVYSESFQVTYIHKFHIAFFVPQEAQQIQNHIISPNYFSLIEYFLAAYKIAYFNVAVHNILRMKISQPFTNIFKIFPNFTTSQHIHFYLLIKRTFTSILENHISNFPLSVDVHIKQFDNFGM